MKWFLEQHRLRTKENLQRGVISRPGLVRAAGPGPGPVLRNDG